MNFWRCAASVFLLACMVWMGIFSAAQAAPRQGRARECLEQVQKTMAQVNSVHIDAAFDLKTQLLEISAVTAIDFVNRPSPLGKIDTEGCIQNGVAPPYVFSTRGYYAEEGGQIIVYQQSDGKWRKEKRDSPQDLKGQMAAGNEAMRYVKNVKIKQETDELIVLDIAVDAEKLCDDLKKITAQMKPRQGVGAADMEAIIWPALRAVKEFSVIATIDRKTNYAVNLYADVSAPARRAAAVMIEKAPLKPEQKIFYTQLLKDLQLVVQEDFSEFDAARVDIPREVKDAPDAPQAAVL